MLQQSCALSEQCQFMYECLQGVCQHSDIFPLSAYTVFIYFMTGLFASLCNVSGNSMGIFKMLILIMCLGYDLDEATGLAQALVVGSALPNFFSIIFKRHPEANTSLVNYRLLEIIIPCCLLGSVVGAIGQTLIPKLGQIILLVLVFSFFTFNFVQKLRKLRKAEPAKDSLLEKNQVSVGEVSETESQIERESLKLSQFQGDRQYQQIIDYEKSYHLKDILQSVLLFVVFQFISFLFQGKLPFYSVDRCSFLFPIGIAAIAVITMAYVYLLKLRFKKLFATYRRFGIHQQIQLDHRRQFSLVIVGAFCAGVIQGVLGMGCGTCIMLVLMSFNMNSVSASATSGYQILFTGSASLLQFYMNGEVEIVESAWFLGVCCVVGGAATLGLFQLFKRFNQVKVNVFLIVIILFLCLMSIFLTIPTVLKILSVDGWEGLTKIAFKC